MADILEKLDAGEVSRLEDAARNIRKNLVDTIYKAGDGHPAPALSASDILAVLYFKIMKLDPKNPLWEERDRLILSKGHACPALYSALAMKGYFPETELPTLRKINSKLQGHPDMKKTPGVDSTSGSLGNGISVGLGMALAARVKKLDYFTYVVTGDGELQEGIIWEALMSAAKYKTGNLIVIVDNNGMQSGGHIEEVSGLCPILPKWEAFGWHCQEIDGHDVSQIYSAIKTAQKVTDRPSMILAHTIKGKGVPYMENNNAWHKGVPSEEQWKIAMEVLGGASK